MVSVVVVVVVVGGAAPVHPFTTTTLLLLPAPSIKNLILEWRLAGWLADRLAAWFGLAWLGLAWLAGLFRG